MNREWPETTLFHMLLRTLLEDEFIDRTGERVERGVELYLCPAAESGLLSCCQAVARLSPGT